MASTYMGKPYYPAWLDNLADDVTGEGAAWDGAIEGAEAVHEVVVAAKEIYEFQDFLYAGPCGENSFPSLVTFPWVNLRAPALGSHACV